MKKAQSGVITAVILIVLVLAGIVIVWNVVNPLISKSGKNAEDKMKVFSTELSVENVNFEGETKEVRVKRVSGTDNLSSLNFIFEDMSGVMHIVNRTKNLPLELETRSFLFNSSELNSGTPIKKITVIPVIGTTTGMEYTNQNQIIDKRNIFDNLNAETGTTTGWTGFSGVSNNALGGVYAFYGANYTPVTSDFMIPIDPNIAYYQEGWFKSTGVTDSNGPRLYFGYIPLDADKHVIYSNNVNYYANSNTTLFEACKSGDKVVKIVNCDNWVIYSYAQIAFNIDNSGNYNDLPNRNLSNYNIINKENFGTYCNITFNTNVGVNASAGTKVREHWDGSTYQYTSASYELVPDTWKKFSSTIKGISNIGEEQGKFRKGTKYAQILLLLNYNAGATVYRTEVDNITVTFS